MWKQLLARRWPWLGAAALVVLAWLSTFVDIRIGGGDADRRARGSVEDLARLGERRDLNLLFVLIDTLRADRVSSYGYTRETSPLLDLLAARGVRFAHHTAQSSWTKCSMASLWTAMLPARNGITRFDQTLPQDALLPAEILREAGFRTAGLYRNGWVAPSFGFGQGFEVYDRPVSQSPPPTLRRDNPTLQEGGTDDDAIDSAIEFLRVHGNERWFLYLHLMDLHEYTYDEESALFGSAYSDVYDNSLRRVNGVLDRLLGHLAQAGQLDRTLIAIASDHGEAFGEHGAEGHARNVYREATEVPFILSLPFRLEPGVVVQARTSNVDVWPTLLELLGLPGLPSADGRSRVPEIRAAARGETAPGDGTAYAHLDQSWGQRAAQPAPTVAVVEGGFRFVRTLDNRGQTREELFLVGGAEPDTRSVLDEQPEAAARLRARAADYLAQPPADWAARAPTLELDELQLNQLRALGYAVP